MLETLLQPLKFSSHRDSQRAADAIRDPGPSADDLSRYAHRPIAFIARYLRRRALSHVTILTAVIVAVACSVATQYGVKLLVDTLSRGPQGGGIWHAFAFLVSLIACDNLLDRKSVV